MSKSPRELCLDDLDQIELAAVTDESVIATVRAILNCEDIDPDEIDAAADEDGVLWIVLGNGVQITVKP